MWRQWCGIDIERRGWDDVVERIGHDVDVVEHERIVDDRRRDE